MPTAPIHGLDPIENRNAEVLILGSMPGQESLNRQQYYAHGQNAFWRILAQLLEFDARLPYAARVRALKSARIAVWDVLHSCVRVGSADAGIDPATLAPNDFTAFFRTHRRIRRVFFNGAMAQSCYVKHVLRETGERPLQYRRLPSTSPAYASLPFARKLKEWRVIVD